VGRGDRAQIGGTAVPISGDGTELSRRASSAPDGDSRETSRTSSRGAGWDCLTPGSFSESVPAGTKRLSWFNLRMFLKSRNDILARLSDPVFDERARWVAGLTDDDLRVDLSDRLGDFSFLLVGDTGEGDQSQYALAPLLTAQAADAAFLVICGDVLYPIGDVNDYADKFYRPYSTLPVPIYAVPGNHDWYDNLVAFMYHVCGRTEQPARPALVPGGAARRSVAKTMRRAVRRWLWRRPVRPDLPAIETMKRLRAAAGQGQPVPQPGPYYVMDTEHLRFVAIDTGILGNLDAQQGGWLVRVSRDPRPKILLTGKPLFVDGTCAPCPIEGAPEGFATVLDVVNVAEFRYGAVIGGDIHNYQRYPVRVGDRVVQHIVSGGGGAFMHATHLIPPIDPSIVPGVTEDDFRCYPLRRDSLAAYSRVLEGMVRRTGVPVRLAIEPDEAAVFLSTPSRLPSTKATLQPLPSRPVSTTQRRLPARTSVAARVALMARGGKGFHKWFSPFYDWDTPPLFKNFLRLDVSADSVRIRCFGVTGCGEQETDPPVEDSVDIAWRA
jgi:Calcineurin-like phosphoesterase